MTIKVAHTYQLDECLDWILQNQYKRVILEFKHEDLKDSVEVVRYLKEAHQTKSDELSGPKQILDIYVTQSNTCCVDLIVTQHVSNVDAIINFGKVCLSKPYLANQDLERPILFAFGHVRLVEGSFDESIQKILCEIESVANQESDGPIYLLYDSNLIDYAITIRDLLRDKSLNHSVEVAQLICPSHTWHTTPSHRSLLTYQSNNSLGQYCLSRPIDDYKSAIYLGDRLSIHISLHGPSNLWKISCYDGLEKEKINLTRALNRRMALVDRLRDYEELKIGVIITNPLPNISEMMQRLQGYAKSKKHTLYFISMVQIIDECKIGNFDLCDAFVVVNLCTCSTILESLFFNRPIINDLEFKLACGFEAVYGRVLWPSSESHLTEDDMINKRKVSDASLALVHSRNELLERCCGARINMWSGLAYKATVSLDEGVSCSGGKISGVGECLTIEEGLHGIASTYDSEPLNKSSSDAGDDKQLSGVSSGDASICGVPNIDDLRIEK